jgi:hypothetical protein
MDASWLQTPETSHIASAQLKFPQVSLTFERRREAANAQEWTSVKRTVIESNSKTGESKQG